MSSSFGGDTEAGPSSQSVHSECFRVHVTDVHNPSESSTQVVSSEAAHSSPATTQEDASPSSSRKRSREEALQSDSDSRSLTPPHDSRSESEDSASPSKFQKRRNEDDTPDSTPEPARPLKIQKKLRFHPDTYNNSLWADLYQGKIQQEFKGYNSVWSSLRATRTSSTQTAPVLSKPSSSKAVDHGPGPSLRNPPVQPAPERPNLLKQKKSRRRTSRNRAESFLASKSRDINSNFDSDTSSSDTPVIEDDTSSIVAEVDECSQHDCDDVSVPRSSPPPSARIMAMGLPAAEANRLQSTMDTERKSQANIELPSIYERPHGSLLGTRGHRALPRPMGEDPKEYMRGPPTPEEASQYLQTLVDTYHKLPGSIAGAAMEAFEMITRYQADRYFQAGLRANQTKALKPE